MNRALRRQLSRAKKPGQSFAEVVGARQMIKKAIDEDVYHESVKLESDIMLQRFMWECVVALNQEFGFGKERAVNFLKAIENVVHDVEEMAQLHDRQYAFEKLRQRAQQITGIELSYVHEQEMKQARKYAEEHGAFFPVDDDL